jgi:hypothetical protein
MAKKQNPEKQKIQDKIWELNNSIRHAKTGDEIEALMEIRNGLQKKLSTMRVMDLVPVDVDPNGFFCDSEIAIY